MIKRVAILFEFYRKNLLAVLLLLVLMSASLFYLVDFLGYLGYQTYSLDMIEDLGFRDGVYAMPGDGFDDAIENRTPAYDAFVAEDFSAVDYVVNPSVAYALWEQDHINVVICDEGFRQRFDFADRGAWFTQRADDPSEPVEVVVGGFEFSSISLGDTLLFSCLSEDGSRSKVPVKVVGKDVEPTMNFGLGTVSAEIAAEDIIQNVNNIVYMTEEGARRFFGQDHFARSNNFLVLFRADAAQKEKEEVMSFLSQVGSYTTLDEIKATSEDRIAEKIRADLPQPLFMLMVSVFAMIAVSVLLTNKQMQDYRVYYLVGYSRRRSFGNTFTAICGIGLAAGGINLLYLGYLNHSFQTLKNADISRYYHYLVMNNSAWYILLFVMVAVFLSVLIPFAILKRTSVIELYRRPG